MNTDSAIKIITDSFDKKLFNEKANHPMQSWEWGEARKKMGIEVLRLQDEKNVFQLTFHKIPYTNFKIGYLPRSVLPVKELLKFLLDYGKKNNVIFIKIEPYELASFWQATKERVQNRSLEQRFRTSRNDEQIEKSAHPLFPNWTQILDLTLSEDELLKNMHHKTRYNIRLAEKRGVTVKEISNDEGFDIFAKLYFETTKRQKYFGHNYNYHKIIWESLKNKISHILIAFYHDTPLAAYQLFYFKDTFYYVYGGTSDQHRNLMASNLLMWEAIKLGKKLGAKKLDMWGSLPPGYNQNDPWAGFTRFKVGYGGKFIEFVGSYDLVINSIAYKFYNLAFKLRGFYSELKTK